MREILLLRLVVVWVCGLAILMVLGQPQLSDVWAVAPVIAVLLLGWGITIRDAWRRRRRQRPPQAP
jgi:hypothetical protein